MALQKRQQDIFYQKLGNNIRAVRESANIKQEIVAQVLGLTRISVSNIETGKQKIQLHALMQVANYFKVPVSDLLPPLDILLKDVSAKLEKKISNTEIYDNSNAIEKVRDFIKLSSTTKQ